MKYTASRTIQRTEKEKGLVVGTPPIRYAHHIISGILFNELHNMLIMMNLGFWVGKKRTQTELFLFLHGEFHDFQQSHTQLKKNKT